MSANSRHGRRAIVYTLQEFRPDQRRSLPYSIDPASQVRVVRPHLPPTRGAQRAWMAPPCITVAPSQARGGANGGESEQPQGATWDALFSTWCSEEVAV